MRQFIREHNFSPVGIKLPSVLFIFIGITEVCNKIFVFLGVTGALFYSKSTGKGFKKCDFLRKIQVHVVNP